MMLAFVALAHAMPRCTRKEEGQVAEAMAAMKVSTDAAVQDGGRLDE